MGVSTLILAQVRNWPLKDGPPRSVWQPTASRGWRGSAELHDDRLMAGCFDEADEIARGEPGRGGVVERMAIDLGKVHQRLIDHYNGARRGIVHQGEGRHRA